MTTPPAVIATRWDTPFETLEGNCLHLLRVDHASISAIELGNGHRYDFGDIVDPHGSTIWLFNDQNETLYTIKAEILSIRVTDECDFPLPAVWKCKKYARSFRISGSELERSVTAMMFGQMLPYVITTGNDCIEFLAAKEPVIEAVGCLPRLSGI